MATIDETVNTIITEARTFAQSTYDAAITLTKDAVNDANASVALTEPYFYANVGDFPDVGTVAGPGNFTGQFFKPGDKPSRPVFQPVYVPELPTVDTAPDALDTSNLFDVARPDFVVPEFQDVAPVVNTNFSLPSSPTLVFPDAPETSQVDIPDAPDVTLPRFEGTLDASAPIDLGDISAQYEEAFNRTSPQFQANLMEQMDTWIDSYAPEYRSAMAKLEAKIAQGMDGGTAMSDTVEQRIYDRARFRAEEEYSASMRDMERDVSTRGYPIPPGLLNELSKQLRTTLAKSVVAASTDVAIERAKMENQHAQFIMQVSSQLRQLMVNGMLQYADTILKANGQALQYSKEVNAYAIEAYNAALERFKVEVSVYQIKAQVYEVELKSALADLQAYEIEVEALKLRKDVEKQDLDIYVQKINAQKTKIDLFLAQLQGVKTEAETKQLAISLYGEKVKAHSLLVSAKQAEFGAYEAAIRGDTAKVQAYAEEVNAYKSRIEAYRSQAAVEQTKAQISLESNRNLSAIYEADIRKYLADVQVEQTTYDGQLKAYTLAIDKYRTDLTSQIEILQAKLAQTDLEVRTDLARYDGKVKFAVERARVRLGQIELRANTSVAAAQTLNTMAAAALGSQNSMVTLTAEESV